MPVGRENMGARSDFGTARTANQIPTSGEVRNDAVRTALRRQSRQSLQWLLRRYGRASGP